MRKVTRQVCSAFLGDDPYRRVSNTETRNGALFLHGNKIAQITDDGFLFSFQGWVTPTTLDRLNGVLELLTNRRWLRSKQGTPFFDASPYGKKVTLPTHDWFKVSFSRDYGTTGSMPVVTHLYGSQL